jgi:hypothetical protein
MADEPVGGAGAGGAGGGGAAPSGVGGSGMSASEIAAPGGDVKFLESEAPASTGEETALPKTAEETKPAEEAAPADIDLSALEEGQPAWLAKVTDPEVKAEIEKLLSDPNKFPDNWQFKDAAERDAFFKELPGGREQVAALQTLSQEVSELDAAIEEGSPEGNLGVAERYLSMAKDGGVGLLRAAAQHMAKASPENWNQISAELVNSTLHANGVGTDIRGVVDAIAEMRTAVQNDDGEAFGRAAGRLLGAPKEAPKTDPALTSLSERENAARTEAVKAQTDNWTMRRQSGADKIETHARTEAGKILSKALGTASVSDKVRNELLTEISDEIGSQVVSNSWLMAQVAQLIGQRTQDGKGGYTFEKTNLKASQADFDKASQMMIEAQDQKLITRAVAKVVSKWAKDRAAGNSQAREKARNAATKTDVGAAAAGKSNSGRKVLTAEMLRGPNALTDEQILNFGNN